VIVDWKGINDADGNPVEYTYDNAVAFFDQFPEIYNYLRSCSQNVQYFNKQRLEDLKNSQEI
jgi:hypothetical protein